LYDYYFKLQFYRNRKIQLLGFLMDACEIYFHTSFRLIYCSKLRGTAQAGGHQHFSVKARIRLQTSPCEICTRKSDTVFRFFSEYSHFPMSTSFHQCSTLIYV